MPGSGKTVSAQHLQDRGFYQFRFGRIIVDEVLRRGWAINPENERIVREEIRADEGMDAIARRALPHLKTALETNECIVIDGLYSMSEYKTLKQELGAELIVIAVISSRRLRYQRLASRPERPLTWEEAERRDVLEIDRLEKGGPIAIADYTLINDADRDTLLNTLDALVAEIGCTP
jgi:dephospho-CoA kinase